jgi:hypothetical protein
LDHFCRAACRHILWFVCVVAGPLQPSAAHRCVCHKSARSCQGSFLVTSASRNLAPA